MLALGDDELKKISEDESQPGKIFGLCMLMLKDRAKGIRYIEKEISYYS